MIIKLVVSNYLPIGIASLWSKVVNEKQKDIKLYYKTLAKF